MLSKEQIKDTIASALNIFILMLVKEMAERTSNETIFKSVEEGAGL